MGRDGRLFVGLVPFLDMAYQPLESEREYLRLRKYWMKDWSRGGFRLHFMPEFEGEFGSLVLNNSILKCSHRVGSCS